MDADFAYRRINGHLHQRHTVQIPERPTGLHVEDQHDKGRARAHQHRVEIDRKRLNKTLLARVRDACRSSSVRRRAHAGFVGEQAALDAQHHDRSRKTAENRREVEGGFENVRKRLRKQVQVRDRNTKAQNKVCNGHDRHEHRGNNADALRTAENNGRRKHDENHSEYHSCAVRGIVRDVILECACHVVRLQTIEPIGIADDKKHREHDAQPTLPQSLLNIVRRTAAELPFFSAHFPNLSKRRLDESRGGAQQSHKPHPEDSARTAERNGRSNARNVARANTGCSRNHHGLE